MEIEIYHPADDKLPLGFKFPKSYLDFICQSNEEIVNLYPWFFLCYCMEIYDIWVEILKEQYPARQLVPFAKCNYNDDVACFEVDEDSGIPIIYIIHSFTDPGYEEVHSMVTFEEWLEYAEEDARDYQMSTYGELEEGLESLELE